MREQIDNRMKSILVVEDNRNVAKSIETGLREAGYEPSAAGTLRKASELYRTLDHDLIILDLGLPDGDGMDFLQALRKTGKKTPVIILTARDALDDRVAGLEKGADDYLIKPFMFEELLARIRARLRSVPAADQSITRIEDLEIDRISRTVRRDGKEIVLTLREFDLLALLASSAGFPVSRDTLARDVWKINSRATSIDNVIDVHVSHLRDKIDGPFAKKLIQTVRGLGFMIKGDA